MNQLRVMCKVVCAMDFGPTGFTTAYESCDETSVEICGRIPVEKNGEFTCLMCARCGPSCLACLALFVLCFQKSGACPVSTEASLLCDDDD